MTLHSRRTALLTLAGAAPLLAAPSHLPAQQVIRTGDAIDPNDPLFDFSFLVGRWIGDHDGSIWEETWNPPSNATMIAASKWTKDNRTRFYQFKAIELVEGNPVLLTRHFDPGLKTWDAERDAPVTFTLAEIQFKTGAATTFQSARAVFQRVADATRPRRRLTYQFDKGALSATVHDETKPGKWDTRLTINFRRSLLP